MANNKAMIVIGGSLTRKRYLPPCSGAAAGWATSGSTSECCAINVLAASSASASSNSHTPPESNRPAVMARFAIKLNQPPFGPHTAEFCQAGEQFHAYFVGGVHIFSPTVGNEPTAGSTCKNSRRFILISYHDGHSTARTNRERFRMRVALYCPHSTI